MPEKDDYSSSSESDNEVTEPPIEPPVVVEEKKEIVRSDKPNKKVPKARKDGKLDGRSKPRSEKQLAAIEKLKERNRNRLVPKEIQQEKIEIREHKKRVKAKDHIDELNNVRENDFEIPDRKERKSKSNASVTNNYYYYGKSPDTKEEKVKEEKPKPPEPKQPEPKYIKLSFG